MCALKIPSRPRYRKSVGRFTGIDIKHDESVVGFSAAAECYNYDFSSGALRGGYGISSYLYVPQSAKRFWVYRYYSEEAGKYVDQYIFQMSNGMLRYYDPVYKGFRYLSGFTYGDMDALNYRLNSKDVLLMSPAGGKLHVWDGDRFSEQESAPIISSMALHFERLFVTSPTEPTKVFFSDDLDPTNWSTNPGEGGFIELLDERGELTKVVSFGGYLYIFREHGISRVSASGSQSEFSVVGLYVSAGRIFPSSIVKCGGLIMFMASDGMYAFDGYECHRVLTELSGLISDPGASAYFDGKYYLSCKMDFADGKKVGCETGEYVRNGLLVYDVTSGEYSISRGVDIGFMNVCTYLGKDFLMASDNNKGGAISRCGKRFNDILPKHWRGPLTDLGMPDKIKSVREAYIDSDTECTIGIHGKRTRSINVKPGTHRIRLNVNEYNFALSIDTTAPDCNIKPPTLIYSSR